MRVLVHRVIPQTLRVPDERMDQNHKTRSPSQQRQVVLGVLAPRRFPRGQRLFVSYTDHTRGAASYITIVDKLREP
jgi:hypothetical protein